MPTIRELDYTQLGLYCIDAEFADAAFGAHHEWKGESVPAFVSVRSVSRGRLKGTPVEAIVGGNVGAVGADCDPGVCGAVVSDARAITARRGHRRCRAEVRRRMDMRSTFAREDSGVSRGLIWFRIVAADYHESEREIAAVLSGYGESTGR